MAYNPSGNRTSQFRLAINGILGIAGIMLSINSNAQLVEFAAEQLREQCEQIREIVEWKGPGPIWGQYEPIESEEVLSAIEIDGAIVPYFPLDDFELQESVLTNPRNIIFRNGTVSVIQSFIRNPFSAEPVYGQELVDAGLIDSPLDVFDLQRRSFNLKPNEMDCSDILTSENSRELFDHLVDLSLVSAKPPGLGDVIDVGNTKDYLVIHHGNASFSFNAFSNSGVAYSFMYGMTDAQEFDSRLNAYVWALENKQYKLEQDDRIFKLYSHVMTPEEKLREVQRNENFFEMLETINAASEEN